MPRKSDRIRQDAGWVKETHLRGTCRLCGDVINKKQDAYQRTFHRFCAEHWLVTSNPAHVRMRLQERDHGICSRCGLDTDELEAAVLELTRQYQHQYTVQHGWPLVRGWLAEQRLNAVTSLWEAHHRLAVVEGGGGCGIDGYETLCRFCHRRETAALAARRAQQRKEAKQCATHGTDSKPVATAAPSDT